MTRKSFKALNRTSIHLNCFLFRQNYLVKSKLWKSIYILTQACSVMVRFDKKNEYLNIQKLKMINIIKSKLNCERKNKRNCPRSYLQRRVCSRGMVFCYQHCAVLLWEKIVSMIKNKFGIPGWICANILRSLEQFIQTLKGQKNFW